MASPLRLPFWLKVVFREAVIPPAGRLVAFLAATGAFFFSRFLVQFESFHDLICSIKIHFTKQGRETRKGQRASCAFSCTRDRWMWNEEGPMRIMSMSCSGMMKGNEQRLSQ